MDRLQIYHEQINIMLAVLEDDHDFTVELRKLFAEKELSNYEFYPTGEELIKNKTPDFHIVVLDHLGVGGMNGLEVMIKILDDNPYCYPIIYSAQESKKVIIDYLNNGAYKYIDKNEHTPKEAEELLLAYIKMALAEIKDEVVFVAGIKKKIIAAENGISDKTETEKNDNI